MSFHLESLPSSLQEATLVWECPHSSYICLRCWYDFHTFLVLGTILRLIRKASQLFSLLIFVIPSYSMHGRGTRTSYSRTYMQHDDLENLLLLLLPLCDDHLHPNAVRPPADLNSGWQIRRSRCRMSRLAVGRSVHRHTEDWHLSILNSWKCHPTARCIVKFLINHDNHEQCSNESWAQLT